ncbi:hypothetical protein NW767_005451 [Fusarium falciforme]|nr:hypothetical protein NW767_005451 [Fusarium falciforme]
MVLKSDARQQTSPQSAWSKPVYGIRIRAFKEPRFTRFEMPYTESAAAPERLAEGNPDDGGAKCPTNFGQIGPGRLLNKWILPETYLSSPITWKEISKKPTGYLLFGTLE